MKIQTFTVVAGSLACNARCPFCVAQMTPESGITNKLPPINTKNLKAAIDLSKANGVTTCLITSKGEATLFPDQLVDYMYHVGDEFPIVELQTNAIVIDDKWDDRWHKQMTVLSQRGLNMVAISVAHWEAEKNRQIYVPHRAEYINLDRVIDRLHSVGLSVRLTVTMTKGTFDSVSDLAGMIAYAKTNGVEQLTVRPVAAVDPEEALHPEVAVWAHEHMLATQDVQDMVDYAYKHGTKVMTLPHGAEVFDVRGQNLCLTDCLTIREESDDIRQLIFFPDGSLRYDWRYEGARIL